LLLRQSLQSLSCQTILNHLYTALARGQPFGKGFFTHGRYTVAEVAKGNEGIWLVMLVPIDVMDFEGEGKATFDALETIALQHNGFSSLKLTLVFIAL
jgi:hypothetical protein